MELYTLKEIALMTGYTTRTLRTYMKNGVLKGSCKEGKWFFTKEALEEFLDQPYMMDGVKIKSHAFVKQFIERSKGQEPRACLVYDLPGDKKAVMEVVTEVMDYVNEEEGISFTFSYYYEEKENAGRFVFVGELQLMEGVVKRLLVRKK